MNELKNNNPILNTKEFKVLLNLLEKAEQIISIIDLPDSSISKYNTLKKMTFDLLNIDFIPLQKKKITLNEPILNNENENEILSLLYMLNTQKIMLIQLLLDFIQNNNSVMHEKKLNHFLGNLTEIYNLSKEPFNKKNEEEIFHEVHSETQKLSETFTRIDKIFVDNFDASKQIRINYENELNKLREKYDKDLDQLKMSLGRNSFPTNEYIQQKNVFGKNNYYLNKIANLIDESYEKYKRIYINEGCEINLIYGDTNDKDYQKLDFLEKVMNKFFEGNNILKKCDLESNNYNNCIGCNAGRHYYFTNKLNDVCSFLPEIQKESDIFHKKFCELMNYIETNIVENQ